MTAKIKQNAASGGGSVSQKAPSTTTSNAAVELQLPVADGSANQVLKTDGSGNLSFAADAGGKVLQVKSATKTGTATTQSATYSDISGMSVTLITPQSGSKVLVSINLQFGSEDNSYAGFKLLRDSTMIGAGTEGTGNMSNITFGTVQGQSGNNNFRVRSASYSILDTHGANGSTNVTYKLQFASLYATRHIYINRPYTADNNAYNIFGSSTITAIEVDA